MSKKGRKNRSLRVAGGTPLVEALATLGALKLRIDETKGSKPGRPEFEVWAPDGYNFGGAHSLIERDSEELIRIRSADILRDLERCPAGCECGWDVIEEAAITCSDCTKGHGAKLAKPCGVTTCECFCNR